MSKFRQMRAVAKASVAALVLVALAVAGFNVAPPASPRALPKFELLTSTGGDFTIQGTVYTWPSCTGQSPTLLGPGASDCLLLTVTDNLHVAISITQITAQITSAVYTVNDQPAPSQCVTYLSPAFAPALHTTPTYPYPYSHTWTGLSLDPGGHNQTDHVGEPFSFVDQAPDQSTCEGVKYNISYSGQGTYIEPYMTSTGLASSVNPSVVGQSVTYTATVTASAAAGQDPVPSNPTGKVTFKDSGTTICSNVTVVPSTTSVSVSSATCTPPTYVVASSHPITATYANTDGNFSGGSSSTLTQVINPSATTTSLTNTPSTSNYGQSVSLTATVTPSSGPVPVGSVGFYLGTPTANHMLIGTGTLSSSGKATISITTLPGGSDSLYSVYAGSTNDSGSTSAAVTQTVNFSSCITTKVSGNVTVPSSQDICIKSTGSVGGNVTVNGGGRLDILGGNVSGNVSVSAGGAVNIQTGSIGGNLTATSANYFTVCGARISGSLSAAGTTAYALVGDAGDDGTPGCSGNIMNGNLSLSNSTAGAEIGANTVGGGVSLTGTGGTGPSTENAVPEVEKNTIGGGLSCSNNAPAPTHDALPNKVSGTRSGQCSAAGF